jgi:hypothetical protein
MAKVLRYSNKARVHMGARVTWGFQFLPFAKKMFLSPKGEKGNPFTYLLTYLLNSSKGEREKVK